MSKKVLTLVCHSRADATFSCENQFITCNRPFTVRETDDAIFITAVDYDRTHDTGVYVSGEWQIPEKCTTLLVLERVSIMGQWF